MANVFLMETRTDEEKRRDAGAPMDPSTKRIFNVFAFIAVIIGIAFALFF